MLQVADGVLHPRWRAQWGDRWTDLCRAAQQGSSPVPPDGEFMKTEIRPQAGPTEASRGSTRPQHGGPTSCTTDTLCDQIRRMLASCDLCQVAHDARCYRCALSWCKWCTPRETPCEGCGWVRSEEPPRRRTYAQRKAMGQLLGRNVHRVGSNFVAEVVACRWAERPAPASKDQELELADQIEFKCRLQGWDPVGTKAADRCPTSQTKRWPAGAGACKL